MTKALEYPMQRYIKSTGFWEFRKLPGCSVPPGMVRVTQPALDVEIKNPLVSLHTWALPICVILVGVALTQVTSVRYLDARGCATTLPASSTCCILRRQQDLVITSRFP